MPSLTEAHRLLQVRLGAQVVARMQTIWPLLDGEDLDGSLEDWLDTALTILEGQQAVSSRLAVAYLAALKRAQLGPDATIEPVFATFSRKAAATSLLVTGPLSVKRAMARGVQLGPAMSVALAASSAAGMRYALNGGRDTTTQTIRADRDAKGWERVTSGNACAYCDSRAGIRFATDEVFPAHDGCSCSAAPIWG